jgi:hypothetical protein
MTYEEKRKSNLYKRKNIEYVFTERLRPSVCVDDKYHRILSILGRGLYLYNEDKDIFLLMFGTHYSDNLVDSWIHAYGINLGIKPTLFTSLAKKHWYKHLYAKDNVKQKLEKLIDKQSSTNKTSKKYKELEFLIEETIANMIEEQTSSINKDNIYSYRKKASFNLYPDILHKIKGYDKLCKYGRFSARNKEGMTLDHKLSIKFGYDNDIPPYILAHPANCEFLSLKDNSSKNKRCSISYHKLLHDIDVWDNQLVTVC